MISSITLLSMHRSAIEPHYTALLNMYNHIIYVCMNKGWQVERENHLTHQFVIRNTYTMTVR